MFKRIRIALLLYTLLFVALSQYLSAKRSTDWNDTLRVHVYAINADGTEASQHFIDSLESDGYASVETFLEEQARRYGISKEQPFRIRLAGQIEPNLPPIPESRSIGATIIWSLRTRWFVSRLHWASELPTPDITLFAVYQTGELGTSVDKSTALRKGMIAIANLYAARSARGSNQMIIAHELMHTLGATDKYDPVTALPLFPSGFAEPDLAPLYPQSRAEIMGGRIPQSSTAASIPDSLSQVLVGPATAFEIGWNPDAPVFP